MSLRHFSADFKNAAGNSSALLAFLPLPSRSKAKYSFSPASTPRRPTRIGRSLLPESRRDFGAPSLLASPIFRSEPSGTVTATGLERWHCANRSHPASVNVKVLSLQSWGVSNPSTLRNITSGVQTTFGVSARPAKRPHQVKRVRNCQTPASTTPFRRRRSSALHLRSSFPR